MHTNFLSSKELISTAEKYTSVITKETETGQVVLAEQGARLLGVFPETGGDNVLWVNTDLETYLQEHHSLVGGNRLSIIPEKSFFYENPRDFEGYHVPSEIDPGEYSCIEDADTVTYENTFSLLAYDKNRLHDNSIEQRTFTSIADPYHTGLSFAGVSICDTLSIIDTEITVALASLTKVNTLGPDAPGTILIPVKSGCDLITYYEPLEPGDADIAGSYCRFKIDGEKTVKIAVQPEHIQLGNACKIIYILPSSADSNRWLCVIKRSKDIPESQDGCIDIPETDPEGPRGGLQVLNASQGIHETDFYQYGELTLHFSKGTVTEGKTLCKADHELLAYCGNEHDILEVAKTALETEKAPVLY